MLFLSQMKQLPAPYSSERVKNGLEEWHNRAATHDDSSLDAFARRVSSDTRGGELLAAVFGNSPFLSQCLLRNLEFARDLIERGPQELSTEILGLLPASQSTESATLMVTLREFRSKMALLVAAADIAGIWSLPEVTRTLSKFACESISVVINHLLAGAAAMGDVKLLNEGQPADDSGFTIIGMGKLGAGELNYSSDIDLITLFDQEKIQYTGRKSPQDFFVRLTKGLVKFLQSRTKDGYVFRTDLRLRPDTGSSPLAMSMAAAEAYYESVGQNWERAALIKAAPVAGDIAAGQAFLDRIAPFIWRKYLDFAAIEDIHSIKRQIHAHRGHGSVVVPGHNVKVGRGGIREIEFFAQTQQLIAGGRDPSLRVAGTCNALRALVFSGRLDHNVADELGHSYEYLRRLEHRLQMIADEQTHSIPEDDEGLAHISAFMGFVGAEAFMEETLNTLRTVEQHYANLFEHAPALGDAGNLVFTGTEDDPETISTLTDLGYGEPSTTATLIRTWHHGRYRAMRSARAREMLTELTPALLRAFARTANPNAAVLKFDEFLAKLPAGVQIFSLFYANPDLLDLVAVIMGSAPRLAEHLARNPRLMDNVLSTDFYDPIPDADDLAAELSEILTNTRYYEETLDASRRWGHDQAFQAGVHILRNISTTTEIGPKLTDVADVLIKELFEWTVAEFVQSHGRIPDGEFAIVALGKFGSRELTPESDLDLAFIYDCPASAKTSDGERPLSVGDYYSRLSKRVINAVSALTAEGRLYDVDMRLRPSGNSGPIAVHIDGFEDYQQNQAWTWEHMALTRARVVVAPTDLRTRIDELIDSVVRMPRNPEKLLVDVAEMHDRIVREHGTQDPWQIKFARGGLFELEFMCQYLVLRYANEYSLKGGASTFDAIRELRQAEAIDEILAKELSDGLRLFRNTQGFLRLTLQTNFMEENATEGLRQALARTTGLENFDTLKLAIAETERRIHALFQQHIVGPAHANMGPSSEN